MRIIKKHQTLADFVAQHGGSMNAMFEMALLNGISISTVVAPGTELLINEDTDETDRAVTDYYISSGLNIAGAFPVGQTILGGIGYMQIQNDFKVS